VIWSALDVSIGIADWLHLEASVRIVVLQIPHFAARCERAAAEEIADDFYGGKPNVSAPGNMTIYELPTSAGVEDYLTMRVQLATAPMQVKVVVRQAQPEQASWREDAMYLIEDWKESFKFDVFEDVL
jgi:hypothetical protein